MSRAHFRSQESAREVFERLRSSRCQEFVGRLGEHRLLCAGLFGDGSGHVALHQQFVRVVGRCFRRSDEGDVLTHRLADDASQQRVVRTPQDDGVDVGVDQWCQVVACDGLELRPGGDACFDEFHEAGACG